jgi:hypothetical protein
MLDDERVGISRRDLVTLMANQGGGSHVDPAIDRMYARLTRQNSIGWNKVQNGVSTPALGIETRACAR